MQPSLFVSHGAPTLAIEASPANAFLQRLGRELNRPDAILIISAHHVAAGAAVTSDGNPATIHDFGGFPSQLYQMGYSAPGNPALARELVEVLKGQRIDAFEQAERGFDHGAWIPLLLMYPQADIPVIQLSVDVRRNARWHFRLGQAIASLRKRNILIIGSGSMTHNLGAFFGSKSRINAEAPHWVTKFANWCADAIERGDTEAILTAIERGPYGKRNHPTPEHLLPLFVSMGASANGKGTLIHSSTTYGVLSMDAYRFD